MSKRFGVGDEVMAKWPGSKMYYPAKVTEIKECNGFAVKFEDGGEMSFLDSKYIKSKNSFRQRSKSPAPRKRSRTPDRLRHKKPLLTEGNDQQHENNLSANKTTKTMPRSAFNWSAHIEAISTYFTLMMIPIILPKLCDTDDCLILSSPLSVFNQLPHELNGYFNVTSFVIIMAYTAFITLLFILPFGRVVEGPMVKWGQKLKYRLNGSFILPSIVSAYCLLLYFDVPVKSAYNNFMQIIVVMTMMSIIFNIAVYVKSLSAPVEQLYEDGNSGWPLLDMMAGREVSTRFGNHDFKLYSYHYGFGILLLINLVCLQVEYETTNSIRWELLLACGMLFCYAAAGFYFNEEKALHTFDFKYEGCGGLFAFGVILYLPIVYSMHPLYILQHQTHFSAIRLLCALVAFVVGFSLVLTADMMKFWFRKDPDSEYSRALPVIEPTKKGGRKLLVAGPWGALRHPNYLGETMVYFALSLTCGFQHVLYVWFCPVFVLSVLCGRCYRDDKVCLANHGQAWLAYCKRVPYRIIPYIF